MHHFSFQRCLMLLEALMSSDLVNLEVVTSVCRDNLVNVYHSEQGPAQSKARKVLAYIYHILSYDVCNKIDKPQVDYRFSNVT